MSIIIGADLVPTDSNIDLFSSCDVEKLIGKELMKIFSDADYRIFNLETPISDSLFPIAKCGCNFIAPTSSADGIKALGVDLFTLANNHIMDQGVTGLKSTIEELDARKINHLGAGLNLKEASEPFFFTLKGRKYGVYACAEHEFSIASETECGANPVDLLETPDVISEVKQNCDYLIVLYHGGKEYYRYPSPEIQKLFRKLAEKGADLVIAQHTHSVGCYEEYNKSILVYGQGNFLLDDEDNEYYASGILIKICDDLSIDFIPVEKKGNHVALSYSEEIVADFKQRSEDIKKEGFIEKRYQENSDRFFYEYCGRISGLESFVFKVMNKLSNGRLRRLVYNRIYRKKNKRRLAVINVLECEAHREMFLQGLHNLEKK